MEQKEIKKERDKRDLDKNIRHIKKNLGLRKNKIPVSYVEKYSEFNLTGKYEIKMDGKLFYPKEIYSARIFQELFFSNTDKIIKQNMNNSVLPGIHTFNELFSRNHLEHQTPFYLSWFSCNCLTFLRSKLICLHICFALYHTGVFDIPRGSGHIGKELPIKKKKQVFVRLTLLLETRVKRLIF